MARNQEKKTPVIVVKKRRVISPPVVDKTETVIPPVPEVAVPPAAADAQLPAPIPRSRQFSRIFALKAAVFCLSGSVSPAIFLPGWLSTLKPGSPGMNGTVPYPVSPPGVSICCVPLSSVPPAMTSTVSLPGRFLRMRQKMLSAGWPSGTAGGRKNRPLWPGRRTGRTQRQNDSAPGQDNPSRSDR